MKLNRSNINLILLLSVVLMAACKRQVIPADEIDLGKEYMKLAVGHSIEYAVDSIIFDDFNQKTDTFQLEFRDEVASTFEDNEGRLSYVINRFYRQDSTYQWESFYSYYATATSDRIEVIDRNLRFIKLVFPVKLNTRWYGNSYLPTALNPELQWMDQWDYKYASINEPYSTGFMVFPSTLTVNQADYVEGNPADANAFSAQGFSQEVYAKNVGLIYKELTRWVYQPSVVKYRKGFTLIMKAKKHA